MKEFDPKKTTVKTREAFKKAQNIAVKLHNPELNSMHLVYSAIRLKGSLAKAVLENVQGKLTASPKDVLYRELSSLSALDKKTDPSVSQDFKHLLDVATEIMDELKDSYMGPEHLFLAALRSDNNICHKFFIDCGLTYDIALTEMSRLRGGKKSDSEDPAFEFDVLKKYTTDLTLLAEQQKLDPIVGRDQEIRQCIQILSRRKKNNPVLIGESGVGKTAIAQGIAQRMASGDAPANLKYCRVLQLEVSKMVAGAKFRGEFEERFESVVKEVASTDGSVILFIDDMQNLFGTGGNEGTGDAASLLKPGLGRGDLRIIGATTTDEYSKTVESDKGLERLLQTVLVEEPTQEEALSILRGISSNLELHHNVLIDDAALIAAVRLSTRYVQDRFLPDKAIDLIDEAASLLHMESESVPTEIDEKERRIVILRIEQDALSKNKMKHKSRLADLQKEIDSLDREISEMRLKWEKEKEHFESVQVLKKKLAFLKHEEDLAKQEGDTEKLSKLIYNDIPEVNQRLKSLDQASDSVLLRDTVTVEDVAKVIQRWTGVPVSKMGDGNEKDRLMNMESYLQRRVIGQEEPLIAVSDAVRQARAGLSDPKQPIGSFLFLGPTGVGKTEAAKALAEFLFDDENSIIRLDMSEYQEKNTVSRLIGSAPGYVGYDEGGQLTEAVRRKPYSIVLFDEIEKAHKDVFDLLLQVLDDGRLGDSKGRLVDFKNTVIILTSNVQKEALKLRFRPEFLNRLDNTVCFEQLKQEDMLQILEIQLKGVHKRLADKNMKIELTDEVKEWMAERGYEPEYGARPLKRLIKQNILKELSNRIIEEDFAEGDTILTTLDKENDKLLFEKK